MVKRKLEHGDANEVVRGWLAKPGGHILVVGNTGAGKTQTLYYLVDGVVHLGKEVVVWFDTGKAAEILPLLNFAPLTIIIPEGCDIRLEPSSPPLHGYEIKKFSSPEQIWDLIVEGTINVVSYERYIRDPLSFTEMTARVFNDLIDRAYDYRFTRPVTMIYDEFQLVAPSTANPITKGHYLAGAKVQMAIELLRSLNVRFVSATQHWLSLRSGVRNSYTYNIAKRGCNYEKDQPKLRRYNLIFETLAPNEGAVVQADKSFKMTMFPFYGKPEDFGRVYYKGSYKYGST